MDEYKNFEWKIHNTHKETIICPSCNSIEIAEVIEMLPFGIYVHNCTKCKYKIMENEWNRVKPKKTIKSIITANDNNTLLTACAILEHRPNMRNKARKEYQKHKDKYGSLVHNYYNKGFEEGYKYAIERLKRHNS